MYCAFYIVQEAYRVMMHRQPQKGFVRLSWRPIVIHSFSAKTAYCIVNKRGSYRIVFSSSFARYNIDFGLGLGLYQVAIYFEWGKKTKGDLLKTWRWSGWLEVRVAAPSAWGICAKLWTKRNHKVWKRRRRLQRQWRHRGTKVRTLCAYPVSSGGYGWKGVLK